MGFDSVKEVLEYSMGKEKEAVEFYEELSSNETFPPAKETFVKFAKEEQKHYDLFKGFLEDNAKLYGYKMQKIEDLKISEYMEELTYRPGMRYNELLRLAMKREEKAMNFYKDMAGKVEDPNVVGVFQMLIQEEAKHKSILEKIYDDFLAKHES